MLSGKQSLYHLRKYFVSEKLFNSWSRVLIAAHFAMVCDTLKFWYPLWMANSCIWDPSHMCPIMFMLSGGTLFLTCVGVLMVANQCLGVEVVVEIVYFSSLCDLALWILPIVGFWYRGVGVLLSMRCTAMRPKICGWSGLFVMESWRELQFFKGTFPIAYPCQNLLPLRIELMLWVVGMACLWIRVVLAMDFGFEFVTMVFHELQVVAIPSMVISVGHVCEFWEWQENCSHTSCLFYILLCVCGVCVMVASNCTFML